MSNQENLIVKDVDFEGYKLKSAQDNRTQKIYVGVRWVCDGIGLSEGQRKRQIANIQSDIVLSKGGLNLNLPTDGGKQEVLCLDIEFLPLWLAKISITPKMQKDSPTVVNALVDYQLKAKDVLAKAFIYGEFDLPRDYKSALSQLMLMCDKNNQLQIENQSLQPKAEQFDTFMQSKGYISLNKTAKALKVGRNKMMAFLRNLSVLFLDGYDNLPYQKYITAGYFVIDCHIGRDGKVHATTRVSSKGVSFIHKLYKKYAPSTERTVA